MGMRGFVCLLTALSCFSGYASPQGEPGRFVISQATYQAPILIAYVDVLDQDGRPPAQLTPADFSANINQRDLKVDSVTSFDKSGEGIAYIFLVDVSKSIQPAQFNEMRSEINQWIEGLTENDQMAIFSFGEQDRQIIDFTSNKDNLKAALQGLGPTAMQTRLYLALRNAMTLRDRTDAKLPGRRAIVILSDGKDEGSGFTTDDVGRLVQQSPLPIYAIGFSRLPRAERNIYLEALNRIAGLSGGLYVEASSLAQAYAQVQQAIRRVFLVRMTCRGCQISTPPQPLEMTLKTGTAARTDRLLVSLSLPPPAPDEPLWQRILDHISWKKALVAIFSLAVVVMVVVIRIRLKKPPPPPVTAIPAPTPQPRPEPVLPVTPVEPRPTRKLQLTVISGSEHGRSDNINLAPRAVIGRDSKCDVSYPQDSEMSARHFEIILAGEHIELQDLGSSNGTLLNGAPLVAQQRIEDGDCVRAGRTEVRINYGA
jgi:VWFA-related protein